LEESPIIARGDHKGNKKEGVLEVTIVEGHIACVILEVREGSLSHERSLLVLSSLDNWDYDDNQEDGHSNCNNDAHLVKGR